MRPRRRFVIDRYVTAVVHDIGKPLVIVPIRVNRRVGLSWTADRGTDNLVKHIHPYSSGMNTA